MRRHPLSIAAAIGAAALVLLYISASARQPLPGWLAAALIVASAIYAGIYSSSGDWKAAPLQPFLRINTITALAYLWGGLAFNLVYGFTSLRWQHGWQYGLVMLLAACGLWAMGRFQEKADPNIAEVTRMPRLIALTALHGAAAFIALIWLVTSGKLNTPKDDWAANIIFVAGGLSVVAMAAIVLYRWSQR